MKQITLRELKQVHSQIDDLLNTLHRVYKDSDAGQDMIEYLTEMLDDVEADIACHCFELGA